MFDAFSRSWEITLLSFGVINKDKELLLFPLLAGIFSFLFMAAMLVPTLLTSFHDMIAYKFNDWTQYNTVDYLVIFITYLGLAFIATFFNVCVVYTTKIRFEGGNATFSESIKFAVSKTRLIFYWSFIAATIGFLFRILEVIAERLGAFARIAVIILASFLGMMWSIGIIFVVPVMVYNNLGPAEAINESIYTLRKTWGEILIRDFGLGLAQFIITMLGFFMAIILMFFLGVLGPAGILIGMVFTMVYLLSITLLFGMATTIFNTALFVYAKTGRIPSGYSQEIMSNAFRKK